VSLLDEARKLRPQGHPPSTLLFLPIQLSNSNAPAPKQRQIPTTPDQHKVEDQPHPRQEAKKRPQAPPEPSSAAVDEGVIDPSRSARQQLSSGFFFFVNFRL